VGIQTAWIGQYPNRRFPKLVRLQAEARFGAFKGGTISAQAKNRYALRFVLSQLATQDAGSFHQFFPVQFVRSHGGAGDNVGDAVT
jgi:hypothetical protein